MTCRRVLPPEARCAAYLLLVGTTGLIFGAIVVAWLAYLVPMHLRRESARQRPISDPATRFSDSVQILTQGFSSDKMAGDGPRDLWVSTPLTRRAAIEAMRVEQERATRRRRNVVVASATALVVVVVLASVGVTPWWAVAVPAGMVVASLAAARMSVRAMARSFERRLVGVGSGSDEDTVVLGHVERGPAKAKTKPVATVTSVELGAPVDRPGTLWDPLPITRPTYVSPSIGRTVRTIDLSAPAPARDNKPVVADAPELAAAPRGGRTVAEVRQGVRASARRAVGE